MSRPAQQFLVVGISGSEDPDPTRPGGLSAEHLAELMLTIARAVLRLDDRTGLVYGGDLRPGGLTRRLCDLVLDGRALPSASAPGSPRRLYNYLAWPYYAALAGQDAARLVDACRFLRVRPGDAGLPDVPDDYEPRRHPNLPRALIASRCLTRMRELATCGGHPTSEGEPAPPMRARILLGGKVSGYASFMPGLFEEFLISRRPPDDGPAIPVFVIGAFGGAAGQLADALLGEGRGEAPLTLKFQLEQEAAAGRQALERLIGDYVAHPRLTGLEDCYLEHRYQMLRAAVRGLRDALAGSDTQVPDNGLTPVENRILLKSRDQIEIRRLLLRGLQQLAIL